MKNTNKHQSEKKMKRTTPVPELLATLIKCVNKLPLEMKLPRVGWLIGIYGEYELKTDEDIYSIDIKDLRATLQTCLQSLPKNFLEYIWDGAIPEVSVEEEIELLNFDISSLKENTEQVALRYLRFRELRNQFLLLTKLADKVLYFGKEKLDGELQDSLVRAYIQFDIDQLQIQPKFEAYIGNQSAEGFYHQEKCIT